MALYYGSQKKLTPPYGGLVNLAERLFTPTRCSCSIYSETPSYRSRSIFLLMHTSFFSFRGGPKNSLCCGLQPLEVTLGREMHVWLCPYTLACGWPICSADAKPLVNRGAVVIKKYLMHVAPGGGQCHPEGNQGTEGRGDLPKAASLRVEPESVPGQASVFISVKWG